MIAMRYTKLLVFVFLASICLSFTTQGSELYGITFSALTDLYSVDQNTGSLSSIGPTGHDNLGDLTSDTRAGSSHLWSVKIGANSLVELNPATGAAISSVPLNSPNSMVSIAFDPIGGKLYGNTSVGFGAPFDALYEINPATGNSTFIGRILFENVFALGFDQTGKLFGIADATDDLISISTTTGNGTFIADVPLGLSFDIASRPEDNKMFLADSGTSSLYMIDTGSGAVTAVGPYGSSANVVGLAFLPKGQVPDAGSTLTLLGLSAAILPFLRRRFVS